MRAHNKIFGIGLSRTGTTSLHIALLLLGRASVHYPLACAPGWLRGDFSTDTLHEFDACLDVPVAAYFSELHGQYPDSLFINTVRDEESWLTSIEKLQQTQNAPERTLPLREAIRLTTYGCIRFNRDRYLRAYREHQRRVSEFFADKPQQLLSLNLSEGDGWQKLCDFLQCAPPTMDFPRFASPYIGRLTSVPRSAQPQVQSYLLDRVQRNQLETTWPQETSSLADR